MKLEPPAGAKIVDLRRATSADSECVLSWANDPGTRRASFHSAPIGRDEHERWFASVLGDPERALLIAELEGTPIAVVRLDRRAAGAAELSLNLAPEVRGRKLSVPVLAAALERARALGFAALIARIRPENEASLRAFTSAGFRPAGREVIAGQVALRYELRLQNG